MSIAGFQRPLSGTGDRVPASVVAETPAELRELKEHPKRARSRNKNKKRAKQPTPKAMAETPLSGDDESDVVFITELPSKTSHQEGSQK